jgi:hypothetical protein
MEGLCIPQIHKVLHLLAVKQAKVIGSIWLDTDLCTQAECIILLYVAISTVGGSGHCLNRRTIFVFVPGENHKDLNEYSLS